MTATTTVQDWTAIIADLQQQRQAAAAKADRLRDEKADGSLCLSAALGDTKAAKHLKEAGRGGGDALTTVAPPDSEGGQN